MPRAADRTDVLLVAAAAAAATAYFAVARLGAGGWVALKLCSVLPLVLLAARRWATGGVPLAVALAAHATGDLLIETAPLPLAMGAFGLGHLLYGRLFFGARRSWEEVGAGAKVRLALLAFAGAGLLAAIAPSLAAPFTVAVPCYALALLGMAAWAQVCRRGGSWVALGAGLYVLSDSLLALDLFSGPMPWTRWWVWPTYWTAQAAIVAGWLWGSSRSGGGERV